jgi:hypothetical protein
LADSIQMSLFPSEEDFPEVDHKTSSTFIDNMKLPVHRWFRYSAGFSAAWVQSVIAEASSRGPTRVLDPFAGSATTLISAEDVGAESCGVESHPFVCRIAKAKLARRSDPLKYRKLAAKIIKDAASQETSIDVYPELIRKCYRDEALAELDSLRRAYEENADGSPASELCWLTLVSIIRRVSHVGTAQWQYVLPNKSKANPEFPLQAFDKQVKTFFKDMQKAQEVKGAFASILETDARTCEGVDSKFANLVITSPPYPNNFDYADSTRLEMTFMREIDGWGDLQGTVRKHLVRSCSQHVSQKSVNLNNVLASRELSPIRSEISAICEELGEVRETKGGRKSYHLMIACYFFDMAQVWRALRSACDSPSRVCFVIGDSAPYGVHVPVYDWMGRLAQAAGFDKWTFEKTRDRNIKWKNRKHRVPLSEGRFWIEG